MRQRKPLPMKHKQAVRNLKGAWDNHGTEQSDSASRKPVIYAILIKDITILMTVNYNRISNTA